MRKNDADPKTNRLIQKNTTAPASSDIIIQLAGQNPIFLGSLDAQSARSLVERLGDIGLENVFVEESILSRDLRANPRPPRQRRRTFDVLEDKDFAVGLLEAPGRIMSKRKLKSSLLPTKCTAGDPQAVTYPIPYHDVQDISLEVAAANLAVFYPSAAHMLPQKVLAEFDRTQNVTQDFIEQRLTPQERAKLRGAATKFSQEMLRQNTKLEQSKVPASTGVGVPSEIEGYNLSPSGGTVGLNLMNANTLLGGSENTDMLGFKQLVDDYVRGLEDGSYTAAAGKAKSAQAAKTARLGIVFRAAQRVLNQFANDTPTCCPYASNDCKVNCLFMSGVRHKSSPVEGKERTMDETAPRMLAGYMHTAFIANPYYFLRLLIDAIYKHVGNHLNKLCEHNNAALSDPSLTPIKDFDQYISVIPPSVRLNVYSDYVWELIYQDMFTLFDLDRPQTFQAVDTLYTPASVMFYDYTKIPGRWRTEQRRRLFERLNLEWDAVYAYSLPKNYHITFSFSGEDASFRHSQVANLAGQNSTFVFSTASMTHAWFIEALENTKQTFAEHSGPQALEELNRICDELETTIFAGFSEHFESVEAVDFGYLGQAAIGRYVGKEFVLPPMYAPSPDGGLTPVISGDLYDSRFLDEYLKRDPGDAVIVGLGWKQPSNVTININGTQRSIEPAICSLYVQSDEDIRNVEKGIGFGIARFNFGKRFVLKKGDVQKVFSIFITAKRPDAQAVNELISDIIIEGDDTVTGITFNTETGLPINTMLGGHNLEFVVVDEIVESLDATFESED